MQPQNQRLPSTKLSAHKHCLLVAPPSLSCLPRHLLATPNLHQSPPASPVTLTHPSIPCQSSFHLCSTDSTHPRPIGRHFKSVPFRLRAANITLSAHTLFVTHRLWYISECLLWCLVVLLYKYGTVPNAGYHSWNPLIVLFSSCDPLTEGYKYNRLSSVLILETQVYICRITSSIGGTSRATPSVGFVCIKTPVQ